MRQIQRPIKKQFVAIWTAGPTIWASTFRDYGREEYWPDTNTWNPSSIISQNACNEGPAQFFKRVEAKLYTNA